MTLTQSDYDLDYLFIAELANGSVVKQTPDDKPKFSNWGTMMTDLRDEKITKFSLVGKGHVFTINLVDGHFESDGNKLYPPTQIYPNADLQLIYYREVTRDFVVGSKKTISPKIKYILGWQYNLKGKNYQWKIGIE